MENAYALELECKNKKPVVLFDKDEDVINDWYMNLKKA